MFSENAFVFDGEVLVAFPDQVFDVSVYPGGSAEWDIVRWLKCYF